MSSHIRTPHWVLLVPLLLPEPQPHLPTPNFHQRSMQPLQDGISTSRSPTPRHKDGAAFPPPCGLSRDARNGAWARLGVSGTLGHAAGTHHSHLLPQSLSGRYRYFIIRLSTCFLRLFSSFLARSGRTGSSPPAARGPFFTLEVLR